MFVSTRLLNAANSKSETSLICLDIAVGSTNLSGVVEWCDCAG